MFTFTKTFSLVKDNIVVENHCISGKNSKILTKKNKDEKGNFFRLLFPN